MLLINNLDFGYYKNKIIDGFSYKFEKGKIYGIFGKSGLGKTTLAKIISGFLKPFEGNVTLENKVILCPSKEIIYISQRDDIFYRLTVYQNLYLLCHNKKKVQETLEKIGLIDYENKFPKELSGGMIRRLSFARILLLKPKVLILDEPFIHLDIKAKEKLIEILLNLQKINKGMILILISHSVSEMTIADKLIIFENKINNAYRESFK